jgi:glycosyltransferase involved in cell wall biosynthesis
MMTKVSICIPTFNSGLYLEEMLDSIVAQTYGKIEVIISDNASTDDTLKIAKRFQKEFGWKLNENEVNVGAIENFNQLVEMASGELVAIYHADDIYSPFIVEETVNFFGEHAEVGLVATLGHEIDSLGNTRREINLPPTLRGDNVFHFNEIFGAILRQNDYFLITPSITVRKVAYNYCGSFDRTNRYKSASDYEMWFRLMQRYKTGIVCEPLIRYRIHDRQGSQLELRANFSKPDSLDLYYHYAMQEYSMFGDLYKYSYYRLMRIVAIKLNNQGSFKESRDAIELISIEAPEISWHLNWLSLANYLRVRISLSLILCIKKGFTKLRLLA